MLNNRSFWIVILICSMFGALLVLIVPSDYDRIKESEEMFVCKNGSRFDMSAPGFKNISDTNDIRVYSELIANQSNLGPKSLSGVSYKKKVYVFKRNRDLKLSLIIVKNEDHDISEKAIYKFWISDSFLSKEPCSQ